jgi:kynureninase
VAPLTRAELEALDRADPLAPFRDEFDLPADVIYLDGNSLGPLPKATLGRMAEVVAREWGHSLIRAWNVHDWIGLPLRVGEKIGQIIGAEPGSTLVADSTSVNLFKLLAAALEARPTRRIILTETGNFPTDLYMAQGLATLLRRGHEVRDVADPVAALNQDVAVLRLTQVNYRSGAMHDIAAVTRAAHAVGALTLWDLSHSVGAIPLQLAKDDADLAVGCGYKYLNGGPGAPAFLSVAPRLRVDLRSPLTGWLGHAEPFAFAPDYRPAEGIGRGMVGTPPVLNLAALEVGVDLMLGAPMDALRAKSQQLIDLFIALVERDCAECGFRLLTPRDAARRGSQVAFAHKDGYQIMQALISRGVIGDFRAPDVMRFGMAPLYVRHTDVWDAVSVLRDVMRSSAWQHPTLARQHAVT